MPIAGIAIIAGFVVIVVLCVIADKNTNKKFKAKFEQSHQPIDTYGDYFITGNGELVHYLPSGSLVGYKVFKLNEIGFVEIKNATPVKKNIYFLDRDGKVMKGEYLTPSKKPLKEYKYSTFDVRVGQNHEEVADLVMRHAPHVQKRINGNVTQ